jgi:glc operon protein GlcG
MIEETTLSDEDATAAIAAIRDELIKRCKTAGIAVVDNHGETIGFLRLKGASFSVITVATNKAYTAARMRRPTLQLGTAIRHPDTGYDVAYYGDPRLVGFGGGLPVIKDGAVIGGIGVSGLSQEEDDALAAIGIAAIFAR